MCNSLSWIETYKLSSLASMYVARLYNNHCSRYGYFISMHPLGWHYEGGGSKPNVTMMLLLTKIVWRRPLNASFLSIGANIVFTMKGGFTYLPMTCMDSLMLYLILRHQEYTTKKIYNFLHSRQHWHKVLQKVFYHKN